MAGKLIPFEPESVETLQSRFVEALREIRIIDNDPPIERKHIFDFEDGLRLIVSRDSVSKRELVVVSASWAPGRMCPFPAMEPWMDYARAQYDLISGGRAHRLIFHSFTPEKGIPQWYEDPGH